MKSSVFTCEGLRRSDASSAVFLHINSLPRFLISWRLSRDFVLLYTYYLRISCVSFEQVQALLDVCIQRLACRHF